MYDCYFVSLGAFFCRKQTKLRQLKDLIRWNTSRMDLLNIYNLFYLQRILIHIKVLRDGWKVSVEVF